MIPLEQSLAPPILALLVAALVPLLTGRLLSFTLLGDLADEGSERAASLAPYRRAAFIVGLAQIQLAWMLGVHALGPGLVEAPFGFGALSFGLLCAVVAFAAGGVARRDEQREASRGTIADTILLRVRMAPWFIGPGLVAVSTSWLPVVGLDEGDWVVAWPWVLAAFAACFMGAAYAGPLLGRLTLGFRRADERVTRLAREVAAREGTPLWFVWRLPTRSVPFANAAAVPWARLVVVTDAASELLDDGQLSAVLAHEAGHLSEGPRVALLRLLGVTLLLVALTTGVPLLGLLDSSSAGVAVAALVVAGVGLLILLRRLARSMEIRADERARATSNAEDLASALEALHEFSDAPATTGAKRVHPDLFDRLAACGREQGERPAPPPKGGRMLGVFIGAMLLAAPAGADEATKLATDELPDTEATTANWRLRVDPWDGDAMLALAWSDRREGRIDGAEARLEQAVLMSADALATYELLAELRAAQGRCDEARDAFEGALRVRAMNAFDDILEQPLELGGYRLPPTFVRACAPASVDAAELEDEEPGAEEPLTLP